MANSLPVHPILPPVTPRPPGQGANLQANINTTAAVVTAGGATIGTAEVLYHGHQEAQCNHAAQRRENIGSLHAQQITPEESVGLSAQIGDSAEEIEATLRSRGYLKDTQEVKMHGNRMIGTRTATIEDKKSSTQEEQGFSDTPAPENPAGPLASASFAVNPFASSFFGSVSSTQKNKFSALETGITIPINPPISRTERYGTVFLTLSITYVIIWPLLCKAQGYIINLLNPETNPSSPETKPFFNIKDLLDIVERYNENKITFEQAKIFLEKSSHFSRVEILTMLEISHKNTEIESK